MNVNLHITGELEKFINELVSKGFAANKTEAIRLAIVKYYEEKKKSLAENELRAFSQASIKNAWDNQEDEKSGEFYSKRYLND